MGIENTVDGTIHASCEFDNLLYYRVKVKEDGKTKQYCSLSDNRCPYYRKIEQQEICKNYIKSDYKR